MLGTQRQNTCATQKVIYIHVDVTGVFPGAATSRGRFLRFIPC